MHELITGALSFPTAVFTLGVGVSLVYWVTVMMGAVDIDFGGEGLDLELDADVGDLDAGDLDAGDLDGDLDTGAGSSALDGVWGLFSLKKAPITVGISFIFVFGWLFSYFGSRFIDLVPGPELVGGLVVFLGSLFAAWPVASLASRPIGKMFVSDVAPSKRILVGRVARMKVFADAGGKGQATLDDGSGSLLRVRSSGGALGKNMRVLLIEYDAEADLYEVEAMEDVLSEEVE